MYYLQSRYYNPEWGRFLNADTFVSTGQGLLGNNMFAYCNNNPVMGCDPCGTCIHYWFLLGLLDCKKCQKRDDTTNSSFENEDGTYSLYDNKRNNPDKLFHEQLLVASVSPAAFSLDSGDLTFGAAGLTVITGGWEYEHIDVSLLDMGHIEAGLGVSDGQLEFGAMASVWAPSITFKTDQCDVTLGVNVLSWGFKVDAGFEGVSAKAGFGCLGFSICIS